MVEAIAGDELFNERVMRAASRQAHKIVVQSRYYVSQSDVMSELYVWLLSNRAKVLGWLQEEQHGLNKLNLSLYRAGLRYVVKERVQRTGCKPGDFYWYSPAVVTELLPDVWDYQDWGKGPVLEHTRGRMAPSEGGNRQAMMIDVASAVASLEEHERALLKARYSDGGVPMDTLAASLECSEDALRKRIERLVRKVVARLGGEPPWLT